MAILCLCCYVMQKNKELSMGIIVTNQMYSIIKQLHTIEDRNILYKAMFDYVLRNIEPDLTDEQQRVFDQLKPYLKGDNNATIF